MSNVVSLQSRDPNKRLVWIERDPAEGFRVCTNYGRDIGAAAVCRATRDDPHLPEEGGVSAALLAVYLCQRDRARFAPAVEFATVLREIYATEFGDGEARL